MSAKIFVGNLDYATTKDQLTELFGEVGEVRDVFLPSDRATGRPRGFAFVEFSSESEAEEAIRRFDEHELSGRKLRVNPAQDRPRRAPAARPFSFENSFGDDGGGFGGRPKGGNKPKGSRRGMRGKKRSL